jgi:uncharacterized protein MJ0907
MVSKENVMNRDLLERIHLERTINNDYFVVDRETLAIIPIPNEVAKIILEAKNNELLANTEIEYALSSINEVIEEVPKGNVINIPKTPVIKNIVLPITQICNLACPYCFANSNSIKSNSQDINDEDISLLTSYLHQLDPSERINIIFFGGEPTLRFDLMNRIINRLKTECNTNNIGYSITTNGTLINDKIMDFFIANNVAILLSLDGMENEYNHRRFKNGKHSFGRVMKSVEMLKKRNILFEVRATLTCDNPYIHNTYMYFEDLKIPYTIAFAYDSYNEEGSKYAHFKNIDNIRESFDKVEQYYIDKIGDSFEIYDKVLSALYQRINFRTKQTIPCMAGRTYFTLQHGGNLFTCPHLLEKPENSIGNIRDFEEVLANNVFGVPIEVDKIEKCNTCWAKMLCMGGCASQKISYNLTPTDPLPSERCQIEKEIFSFYLRLYYHIKSKIKFNNDNN